MVAHRNYASFKSSLAVAAAAAAIEAPKPARVRAPRKAKPALASVPAAPVMEAPAFGRTMERASLVDALRRLTSVADTRRQTLSRLEEGLLHEGFKCDSCGRRVKYVPEVK